jgi:LacI family gluconate utilization system Gnt-I transcriptional repressor
METIGRIAGVSQVTVSRALSDPSKVSNKTLERIRYAIETTGYVPNTLAGALASNRSRLISALVPSVTNVIYASMLQALGRELGSSGYQIMLSETGFEEEREEEAVYTHLSRRPVAIALTGIDHSQQTRRMLLPADIPVVELWDITDSPIDFCVGFSHSETGRAAGEFAARLKRGQAAIVCAGDERARRRGFAFAEKFEAVGGGPVARHLLDEAASLEAGRRSFAALHGDGLSSAVVFCSSDLIAHGVIIEALERGLRVPEDIAVIGFGNQDFGAFTVPSITTVKVDREALGRAAAKALLARVDGRPDDRRAIDIGFEILTREST